MSSHLSYLLWRPVFLSSRKKQVLPLNYLSRLREVSEKSPVGPGFKKAHQEVYRELDASKKGESPIKNELRLSIRGTLDGLEALRSKGDAVGLEKAGVELSKAADQLPPTAAKLATSLRKLSANLSPKS